MTQHLGDVVDQGYNRNAAREFAVADRAHQILEDAGVSYAIIPGNHDVDGWGDWFSGTAWSGYLAIFPESRQAQSSTFQAMQPKEGRASNYHRFTVAGVELMSVNWAAGTS